MAAWDGAFPPARKNGLDFMRPERARAGGRDDPIESATAGLFTKTFAGAYPDWALSTREHWPEVRFGQDASHFFAFVSLNFDPALLDRAADSTSLLHRPRQLLFLRQTDAGESFHDCNSFTTAPGFLSHDLHPSATLARRYFPSFLLRVGYCFPVSRQILVRQITKRIVTELFHHTRCRKEPCPSVNDCARTCVQSFWKLPPRRRARPTLSQFCCIIQIGAQLCGDGFKEAVHPSGQMGPS